MRKIINLIGKKFGRLTVLKRMANDKHKKPMWLCKCDCGEEKIVLGLSLKSGNTKSCGCLQKEVVIKRSTKHGYNKRGKRYKIYNSWSDMIKRCTNPNVHNYNNYGGRGIKVCKRWQHSFANFFEDMGEPPTKKHSLDRIDNNKGYCKSNCRWATPKQQQTNKRNSRLKTYMGKTQCISIWAEEFGINYDILYARIFRYGWSIEKALTTPVRKRRQRK